MMARVTRIYGPLLALVVAVALLGAGAAGCASRIPKDVPGITGTITGVTAGEEPLLATILVEGGVQPDGAVSDKASVGVTQDTRLLDSDGGRIGVNALVGGAQVKVWFTGPVAESYPVQGTADTIQVVEAAL